MSDPDDKPPGSSDPVAPPQGGASDTPWAAPSASTAAGEPASPVPDAPPAPAPPGPPVQPHHAPIAYEPAQFPSPEGGGISAPYNPYGGPVGPPPGTPYSGGPYPPAAPHPGAAYTGPSAAQPYATPYLQHPAYAPPPRPPFPGVGWFLLLVLMGMLGQIVLAVIAVVVVMVIWKPSVSGGDPQQLMKQIPMLGWMIILLTASTTWPAVALLAAKIARVWSRDTFRLRWAKVSTSLLAIVLGVALVPVALLLENLVARLVPRGDNIIVTMMSNEPSTLALVLLGITLVVMAPVGEELLFRGLGQRGIERRYGLGLAALAVSGIFAAIHLNATGFLALFMVSMALCWVTSKSDSLIPAILLHAAYNGVQFVMLAVSDVTPEMARKAAKSTELDLPLWLVPAGVVLALLCLGLIGRLGPRRTVD